MLRIIKIKYPNYFLKIQIKHEAQFFNWKKENNHKIKEPSSQFLKKNNNKYDNNP